MKTHTPIESSNRFNGNLRHYHRKSAGHIRTWDDWVEGGAGDALKADKKKKWLKFLAYAAGAVLLFAIITGVIFAFY